MSNSMTLRPCMCLLRDGDAVRARMVSLSTAACSNKLQNTFRAVQLLTSSNSTGQGPVHPCSVQTMSNLVSLLASQSQLNLSFAPGLNAAGFASGCDIATCNHSMLRISCSKMPWFVTR